MLLGAPFPGGGAWGLPDDVEDGRQDELVVDRAGHVARLVERRRDGAHGKTQVHGPQQEQELSWGHTHTGAYSYVCFNQMHVIFVHFYKHIYIHISFLIT